VLVTGGVKVQRHFEREPQFMQSFPIYWYYTYTWSGGLSSGVGKEVDLRVRVRVRVLLVGCSSDSFKL
jgi:hypothetical protein